MSISIDIRDNTFVLRGDLNRIKSKRRAKSNFGSIGANFSIEDEIIIPFSTEDTPNESDDKESQYEAIKRLLGKFEIEYVKTEDAESFLVSIDQENKNFEEFSLKAKNIRNNQHVGNDFKDFVSVLEKKLKRELYTLQLLSAYHLAFAQNSCNFSVPGAGKTSIVYGAYAYLKGLPPDDVKYIDRLLIICPLSAFSPWENEYKECFGKNTSIKKLVSVSASERKNHFYSDEYTEITLISYQSASNDSDIQSIKDFLKRDKNKVMVVLDEAHRIKNVEGGKWADAMLSIAKYANSRVILTGTPAPNGYQDLYNLYKFIWPSKDIIGRPVDYLQNLSNNQTPTAKKHINELIDNVAPFFIRIKKSNLGLPKPIENDSIIIPMSQTQKLIYEYIEGKYIDYFEKESGRVGFFDRLKKAKLIRLMQCATNPNLLNKALDSYLSEEGLSNDLGIDDRETMQLIKSYNIEQEIPPKFIEILKLFKKIEPNQGPSGKAMIWTIFIQNILDLESYLKKQGVNCELLYGATPNENDDTPENILTREKIIHRFHDEDCPFKVIIANPFAVGESISLHKACHHAIYLEKNFNAGMYMQSKDRIHRYGLNQDDSINYYHLLSENSIDQVIHERVMEKEQRMLDIIESQEIPLLDMNMEDSSDDEIQAVIRDYHVRKSY